MSMTESVRFSMSESASSAVVGRREVGPGGESGWRRAERMVRMEWPGRRAEEEVVVVQGPWVGERIWEPAARETMACVGGWGGRGSDDEGGGRWWWCVGGWAG
jgi:hypothetical protein